MWVGNHDRCGRCREYHKPRAGNDHYCQVHGPVSPGCCEVMCNPEEWVFIGIDPGPDPFRVKRILRSEIPAGTPLAAKQWRNLSVYVMPEPETQ